MIESRVMKKIFRAFDTKDVGIIHSLILHQCINPNDMIPGKGVSLLHLIIGHQSESFAYRVTKLFLRCGGDPNIQSTDGVTPTHVAAGWGRNRILHLLLVNGGDPWMQDDEKKNAFNYAFEEREWNTIEMLHHFQQMHSASKHEVDPKFELNLERVVMRKGQDMFAYAPSRKSTKSMMTQTQNYVSDSSLSPVQEKIRCFEGKSGNRKIDKVNVGWSKDFYQTSCEVIVHCDGSKEQPEEKKKETFVSSIHIETSPPSEPPVAKKADVENLDVRGQLFVELQEAVRRRSKMKMANQKEDQVCDLERKDSFVTKEVSYLYGVNLEDNLMLKNMSDFATKVMKEIEVTEEDQMLDQTIDLCGSSSELTKNFLSCEENDSIKCSVSAKNQSDCSNLYLTPYNSHVIHEKEENSNESFLSVTEEYKYTDVEQGVVLLEKKLLLTPTISFAMEEEEEEVGVEVENEEREEESDEISDSLSTLSSTTSTVPSSISYNSDILRCELKSLGFNPGPVTKTTKKLYLKKLWRMKKKDKWKEPSLDENNSVPSSSLNPRLTIISCFDEIPTYQSLEEEMCRSFDGWSKRRWREGTNKTSFNYLLLDPRISQQLPKRAPGMTPFETWKFFLTAVFYVGKGKRSRPYDHLYQATTHWEKRPSVCPDGKTERIVEIWKEGLGVICLHVFQNIIPVEAFTREAAMIDALGLSRLKNSKGGDYYGVASTWTSKEKVKLGAYLLHKAMLIFLNEGERQIRPYDID